MAECEETQVIHLEDGSPEDAATRVPPIHKFIPWSPHSGYGRWIRTGYVSYVKPRLPKCTDVLSQRSWVTIHCILGTLDVLLNVRNFIFFTSADLEGGLVIGPLPYNVRVVFGVFTAISVIIFVLEIINTLSVLCRDDHNLLVPLHIEMVFTLVLEHIPLAAINYFICTCRQNYTTWWQMACGSCRMLYMFLRLLWQAHIQGMQLKKPDIHTLHTPFFLSVLGLVAVATSFPVQSWRTGPPSHLDQVQLSNVSILFMKTPFLTNVRFENFPADATFHDEGFSYHKPLLVHSLKTVWQSGKDGINVAYACPLAALNETAFYPKECRTNPVSKCPVKIHFRFVFRENSPGNPYGTIHYNYALMSSSPNTSALSGCSSSAICVPSTGELASGWRLFYSVVETYKHEQVTHVNLSSPYYWGCVLPSPVYDSHLRMCHSSPDVSTPTYATSALHELSTKP